MLMAADISLKSSDSIIPIRQGSRAVDSFDPQVLVEVWQQHAEEIRAAQEGTLKLTTSHK